jgi:ElaB/YqjD/DUF883 family membrane-anchored ribosome-binding protein
MRGLQGASAPAQRQKADRLIRRNRKQDVSNIDFDMDKGDNRLAESIARLQDEAETLMGDLPNVPPELKNRLQSLQDQIADLYAMISEEAAYSVDVVEEAIVARPWTSAFIAFGLGCLAATLLRPAPRRSSWHL